MRIEARLRKLRGVMVKNNIGGIVLSVYLFCVMAWMVVMLLVAIVHLF